MSNPVSRETYLFDIDKYGDISASLEKYIRHQESYATAICLDVTGEGMRPFYLHLSDEELLARHPGAVRKQAIQAPVLPAHDDPNFTNLCKLYEINTKVYNSYRYGVTLLIAGWVDFLTPDLKRKIESIDPINGMSSVTCKIIYDELKSRYGVFTESAKQDLQAAVTGDLNLAVSLEDNLTNMLVANACLTSHKIGYSDSLMFDYAFSKMTKNKRTEDIADRYKQRDGYTPSTASFAHFSKYVTSQYDVVKSRLPPSTAAYAFYGESVYEAPVPVSVHDNIAAATIFPGRQITLSEKEYDELVKLAHSPSPTKQSNPSPLKEPTGYCFIHGFCGHGPGVILKKNSKPAYCLLMSDEDGNPKAPYKKEHVMCNSSKGGPINRLPRCQEAARGYKKP
jgi:hypothetical protein